MNTPFRRESHGVLRQLHELDSVAARRFPSEFDSGFGCIGLRLDETPDECRYDIITPANVVTFANTGVDGTHFSLLCLGSEIDESSPVVMTVPGNDDNYVVGETLHDFLCLGARTGFFGMDQIAYRREVAIAALTDQNWRPSEKWHHSVGFSLGRSCRVQFEGGEDAVDERASFVLQFLIDALRLEPWTDGSKFTSLQERYRAKLAPARKPL